MEIVSEGGDPNAFGFVWKKEDIKHCRMDLKNKIRMPQFNWNQYYFPIQEMFKKNAGSIPDIEEYRWIQKMDFSRINYTPMKVVYHCIFARAIRKALRYQQKHKER